MAYLLEVLFQSFWLRSNGTLSRGGPEAAIVKYLPVPPWIRPQHVEPGGQVDIRVLWDHLAYRTGRKHARYPTVARLVVDVRAGYFQRTSFAAIPSTPRLRRLDTPPPLQIETETGAEPPSQL
jgi:hypothetical protein